MGNTQTFVYEIGDEVNVRYNGNEKVYYPAKIIKKYNVGRYDVQFKATHVIKTIFYDDINHNIYDQLLESLKSKEPQNDQYDDTLPIVRRKNSNIKRNIYDKLLESIKNQEPQNDQYDDSHPIVRRRNTSTASIKDHNQCHTVKPRHRGLGSLHQSRIDLMELTYPKKVPLLNIKSAACVEQIIIVFCITTLITLRTSTEHFFYNTRETLHDTFNSKDSLLRTQHLVNDINKQFNTYFDLRSKYVDYIIYPNEILTDTYIPTATATLEFILNSTDSETKALYVLNPYNYSILGNNDSISNQLILALQSSNYISLQFEIESYSFNNEVRNLWRWYLHYSYHIDAVSHRIIPELKIYWLRLSTDAEWWNKKSIGYVCFIVAALGLIIVSVIAMIHFIYQYTFTVIFSCKGVKKLRYRMLLPFSHLICLTTGIIYILNLSQVYDLNDEWWFRGILAITVLIAWCMLSVALNVTTKETQYAALFKTIEMSLKPSIVLLISILPLTMGYTLFGTLLFGIPHHGPDGAQMFTSPEMTAKTLYSVLLGDDVHDSFLRLGVGDNRNIVGEIYMYSWSILFIAIIFNIFLVNIEDNFFKTMPSLEVSTRKSNETSQTSNQKLQEFDEWELNNTIENNYIPVKLPNKGIEIELQKTLPKEEHINRNDKYINSYITHMSNEIMVEINTHLTQLMDKRLQDYKINNLDKLRDDTVTCYENYLKQITQKYVANLAQCDIT